MEIGTNFRERSYECLYLTHLTSINGIKFTRREIDIIACLFNTRGTSKIASILSLALRTIITHSRNIRRKIGCSSREEIIGFLEKSEKIPYIREYYASLVGDSFFKKSLKELSKCKPLETTSVLLVHCTNEHLRDALLRRLPSHLTQLGVSLPVYDGVPEDSLLPTSSPSISICFLKEERPKVKSTEEKGTLSIDISEFPNYYASVFEILKNIFSPSQVEEVLLNFWKNVNPLQQIAQLSSHKPFREESSPVLGESKWTFFKTLFHNKLKGYTWILMLVGACFLFLISQDSAFLGNPTKNQTITGRHPIRSDLIIPSEFSLLLRLRYIKEIGRELRSQKGIQTIALVGGGGTGKTVLARQYAAQQKVPVIWELNAETLESLQNSFSQLAQALVQTADDKRLLTEVKEILDVHNREQQILNFVKERLQACPKWLLIYDNVEDISEIQRYFPQDKATWGEGSVVVTTRNENVQNNSHLKGIISVNELQPEEKVDLFRRIMYHGKGGDSAHIAKIQEFLKQIPSFPLDVSVAAYYLKNMNPSYEGYLENLKKGLTEFDRTQTKLLREAGNYVTTRYQIVTLSLQQLLGANPDFRDLLFLISVLNSQHIPRDVLNTFKAPFVVDSFLGELKKYSLITPAISVDNFSIHRSTQSIVNRFFLQTLKADDRQKLFDAIITALEKNIETHVSVERLSALKSLALHCESLLQYSQFLTPLLRGRVKAELGRIYGALSNIPKQKQVLQESLREFEEAQAQTNPFYARALAYKGIYHWEVGELEVAEKTLRESLSLCKPPTIKNDTRRARSLIMLGITYLQTGRAQEALKIAEQAFLYLEPHQYETAHAFNLLGDVHMFLGNYAMAETSYKRGLAICQQYNTKDCKREAVLLGDLGELYRHCELYTEAQRYHEKSLHIFEKIFPQQSRFVAWALRNMGRTCNSRGNFQEGAAYLKKSVQIYKKILGDNSIKTHWAYCDLAKSYLGLGNMKVAKSIFEDCLLFYNKNVQNNAYWIGSTLTYLGRLHLAEGNIEKGERLLRQGIEIFHERPDGWRLYVSLEKAAGIYERLALAAANDKNQALSLIYKRKAIRLLEQALQRIKLKSVDNAPAVKRVSNKLKILQGQ